MAICRIIETGATPQQYDRVSERIGMGDDPPPGSQLHLAGVAEDGTVRVIEIWDSREQAELFTERIRAARAELGVTGQPTITYMDVHSLRRA